MLQRVTLGVLILLIIFNYKNMKKLIFSAAVLAMAAIGAIKANQNNPVANDLTLENLDQVVAQGEIWVHAGPCQASLNGNVYDSCTDSVWKPCIISIAGGYGTAICLGWH
ncbi:MAG: hypothetical protein J6Y82_06910 [Bacteroidales bacterium]|nr:hypothetical protein [Bacteroidales bacterium]